MPTTADATLLMLRRQLEDSGRALTAARDLLLVRSKARSVHSAAVALVQEINHPDGATACTLTAYRLIGVLADVFGPDFVADAAGLARDSAPR